MVNLVINRIELGTRSARTYEAKCVFGRVQLMHRMYKKHASGVFDSSFWDFLMIFMGDNSVLALAS